MYFDFHWIPVPRMLFGIHRGPINELLSSSAMIFGLEEIKTVSGPFNHSLKEYFLLPEVR